MKVGVMARLLLLLVAFTAVLASTKEHKGRVAHREQHKEHKEHKVQHPVMERTEEAKPLYPFVPFVYPWWDSTATAKYGEAWKDMRNKFTAWWLAYPMMCAAPHRRGRHVPISQHEPAQRDQPGTCQPLRDPCANRGLARVRWQDVVAIHVAVGVAVDVGDVQPDVVGLVLSAAASAESIAADMDPVGRPAVRCASSISIK